MIPLPPSRPGASPRVYDAFIAIDWSGAVKANGIAIAEADARRRTVRPVPPPPGGWTRLGAMIWLAARLRRGPPACVGVDCAFGLPYEPGIGYLDGRVPGVADLFSLWDVVEDAAGAAPDLGGGPVVDDPRFAPSFWRHGPTPPHWRDGAATRRLVERVVAARRLGNPVSVFKLAAASKQVGKASLAGMRALRHLRDDLGDALAVWPVETPRPGQSVALEIFPHSVPSPGLRHGQTARLVGDGGGAGPFPGRIRCRLVTPRSRRSAGGEESTCVPMIIWAMPSSPLPV